MTARSEDPAGDRRREGYTATSSAGPSLSAKEDSMSVSTYLFFDGNCQEAFDFYKSVFGGDFSSNVPFSVGAQHMKVAEADMDRVMHIALPVGQTLLMGSDQPTGVVPDVESKSTFALSFNGDSREQCDDVFAKLSEGGEVMMPQQETFWGDYFGMCRDRYGFHWMVSCRGAAN